MIYTLKNDFLTVKISDKGAEPISAYREDFGIEYLWQGDAAYWGRTAPWLFPVCSSMYEGKYTYRGKEYKMEKHGFARAHIFAVSDLTDTTATFTLTPNEEIAASYPFDFEFSVSYRLEGARLCCSLTVKNNGNVMMPATVGGHPGFNVPLDGGDFSDYYLEFGTPCSPDAVVFTERFYDSGKRAPYLLENSKKMPLSHEMFLIDGIFLSAMAESVALRSDKTPRSVRLEYSGAPYLGIWSSANAGKFLCIEPWYGMASFEGVSDIEEKSNMFRLQPGEARSVSMDMIFE